MKTLTLKKVSTFVAAFAFAVATVFVPVTTTYAATCDTTDLNGSSNSTLDGINCSQGAGTPTTLFGEGSIFTTVVNILLFIIGALCVIMLIYGGIRYTTSGGNSTSVTAAKNTIMYAIIGLVVAFLAFAIVNWVLGSVAQSA